MSAGLLEQLLGEVSSLASVYHKPEETFVGRGRVGADAMKKGVEYVFCPYRFPIRYAQCVSLSSADDRFSTQKALQTVAAGQQAENLL